MKKLIRTIALILGLSLALCSCSKIQSSQLKGTWGLVRLEKFDKDGKLEDEKTMPREDLLLLTFNDNTYTFKAVYSYFSRSSIEPEPDIEGELDYYTEVSSYDFDSSTNMLILSGMHFLFGEHEVLKLNAKEMDFVLMSEESGKVVFCFKKQ